MDSDIDFCGGEGIVRVVLYDIGFTYWKFYVVKEIRTTNTKCVCFMKFFHRLKLMN
jgi:hypothetical protein